MRAGVGAEGGAVVDEPGPHLLKEGHTVRQVVVAVGRSGGGVRKSSRLIYIVNKKRTLSHDHRNAHVTCENLQCWSHVSEAFSKTSLIRPTPLHYCVSRHRA